MNNMIRVLTAASWECENSNRDGREVHRHGEPADERAFVCEKHFWLHLLGKWMRSSNCVVGWGGQENRVADSDSDNARVSGRYRNKVKRPILSEVMSRYNIHDWRAEKHADGQTEKHDGYRHTDEYTDTRTFCWLTADSKGDAQSHPTLSQQSSPMLKPTPEQHAARTQIVIVSTRRSANTESP